MDYEFNQIIFDEDIEDVITRMQRAAIRKGIKARVLEDRNKPWSEKLLILDGVKVIFTPSYDGERCTLEAAVFDKKKIDPKFKIIWNQFQKESLTNTKELSETINQDTVTALSEKKKKGRYRLDDDEVSRRRDLVKQANEMKKNDPKMKWKNIDDYFSMKLDISSESFRRWRHNNY